MYNYKKELKAHLDSILPAYYELFVDSHTDLPCVTYYELANTAEAEGDTLRYSNIAFRVTLWGSDYDDLVEYVPALDLLMFSLGFKRRGYNEIIESGLCQLIFTYQATAVE